MNNSSELADAHEACELAKSLIEQSFDHLDTHAAGGEARDMDQAEKKIRTALQEIQEAAKYLRTWQQNH